MRIAWHVGLTENSTERLPNAPKLWQALRAQAARVVNPGTEVLLHFTRQTTLSIQPFVGAANAFMVAQDVLECEANGIDGVLIGASVDSGVYESRSVTDMPVVGSTESAIAFSSFIGRRVGIIGIAANRDYLGYGRAIEGLAAKYGYLGRLLAHRPVRPIAQSWEEFFRSFSRALDGDSDELMTNFHKVTREFAQDGADVLLSGNQFMGAVMQLAGASFVTPEGLPFIDNAVVGLKTLESLISLRRSMGLKKSEAGDFRTVAPDQVAAVVRAMNTAR